MYTLLMCTPRSRSWAKITPNNKYAYKWDKDENLETGVLCYVSTKVPHSYIVHLMAYNLRGRAIAD